MTSFPLLQLPFLAVENVINQMNVHEQINFADLSKRAQWVVRTSTFRQKYSILFCFSETVLVMMGNSTATQNAQTSLNSYEVAKFIVKISEVFKNVDVTIWISLENCYHTIFELVIVIKQLKISLHKIFVSSGVNDELCQLGLSAAKDAKRLEIISRTSPNFKPQELRALKLEHLKIWRASWFTLDHLVNQCTNCDEIELIDSEMTVRDVSQFLKKWMEGLKIKTFRWSPAEIIRDESILPKVLDGIPCVAVKKARIDKKMKEFGNDACFMIEQVGGVRALVYEERSSVCMTIKFS